MRPWNGEDWLRGQGCVRAVSGWESWHLRCVCPPAEDSAPRTCEPPPAASEADLRSRCAAPPCASAGAPRTVVTGSGCRRQTTPHPRCPTSSLPYPSSSSLRSGTPPVRRQAAVTAPWERKRMGKKDAGTLQRRFMCTATGAGVGARWSSSAISLRGLDGRRAMRWNLRELPARTSH